MATKSSKADLAPEKMVWSKLLGCVRRHLTAAMKFFLSGLLSVRL